MPSVLARHAALAAASVVALLALPVANAAVLTATWTGLGADDLWSNPDNWSDNVVPRNSPTDTFNVVIPAGENVFFDLFDAGDPLIPIEITDLDLASGAALDFYPGRALSVLEDARVNGFIKGNDAILNATNPAAAFTGNTARLEATGGASISLAATAYDARGTQSGNLLLASGATSTISLPNLQTIDALANFFPVNVRSVTASDAGHIDLSALQSVRGGSGDDILEFKTTNAGTIDLSSLSTISQGNVRFTTDALSLALPALATANSTSFSVPAGATIDLPLLTAFTNSTLQAPDLGTINAPNLTVFDGSTLVASGAAPPRATLNIPAFTSITNARFDLSGGASYATAATNWNTQGLVSGNIAKASGAGTLLDLSSVTAIDSFANPFPANTRTILAEAGATIDLSGLQTIRGASGDDTLEFRVDSGASLPLPNLAAITDGNVRFTLNTPAYTLPALISSAATTWSPQAGATLNLPALTTQSGGAFNVPASGAIDAPVLNTLNNASITIGAGGTLSAPALVDFDGSTLNLGTDQTLAAPAFQSITDARFNLSGGASYATAASDWTTRNIVSGNLAHAQGATTLLDLSSVTTLDSFANHFPANTRTVLASDDGHVDLSALETVRGANGDDLLEFRAASGGTIDLTSLASITQGRTRFTVDSEGTILVGSLAVTSDLSIAITDPTSTFSVAESLLLDAGGSISAGGASIISIGANFSHNLTSETALAASTAILRMGPPTVRNFVTGQQFLEVAGLDLGPMNPGNNGNFGFGQLVVGDPSGPATRLTLLDVVDNGNRGASGEPEALYLFGLGGPEGLFINNGSTLNINNINVYFFDDGAWVHLNTLFGPDEFVIPFDNGFVEIPAPPTLLLLAPLAAVPARRRR